MSAETGSDGRAVEAVGPLAGIRVLEFGSRLTSYAGKLFAELGADVVLIEPPGGSDSRHHCLEGSDAASTQRCRFFYQNTSKRSMVVDLERRDAQELLRRMTKTADLVLEDSAPGEMSELGLGAPQLIAHNERLVYTSITPFGQSGPYAQFPYSDLTLMAFGGMLWLGGYAEDLPIRAVGEQAFMAAGLYGAVASMIALTHSELTGEGQHVDVSAQESVAMGLENAAQYYDLNGHIRRRFGGTQREAGFGVFPCRDGYVFLIAAGIGGNRFWPNMVDWLVAEGVDEADTLAEEKWGRPDYMKTEEAKARFEQVFTAYSRRKTKHDLYRESQKWRVPLGPVNMPSDIYASSQLRARDYFVEVAHQDRLVRVPGAPYRLSETPWALTGPAPAVGADTAEVLSDYGIDRDDARRLRESGAVR